MKLGVSFILGVSDEDKALIVSKHNTLRGQQQATNMQKMVCDDQMVWCHVSLTV